MVEGGRLKFCTHLDRKRGVRATPTRPCRSLDRKTRADRSITNPVSGGGWHPGHEDGDRRSRGDTVATQTRFQGHAAGSKSLRNLVRPAGFEPTTLGLGIRCSILLSYGRLRHLYRPAGRSGKGRLDSGARPYQLCRRGRLAQR